MGQLILLRHGQSEWNRKNLFTGWVDIPLSSQGVKEAVAAGQKLAPLPITKIFTSELIRAQMTAFLALVDHPSGKIPCILRGEKDQIYHEEAALSLIPVHIAWQLNERNYGQLQGLNKQEVEKQFGKEQLQQWRRSFREPPPQGESLEMTAARVIPYFEKEILPCLDLGETVLISAHGNSLRAIEMWMHNLSEEEVVHLEIPTGEPRIYEREKTRWIRR